MITLILYGTDPQRTLSRALCRHLEGKLPFLLCRDRELLQSGGSPALVIVEAESLKRIDLRNCLVLLHRKADLKALRSISPDATVILGPVSHSLQKYAAKLRAQVVTVGFSAKDVVTFSSRSEDECVISLQRSIRTADGQIIEPMEIPCCLTGRPKDSLVLAFAAALLLLGQLDGSQRLYFDGETKKSKEPFDISANIG